MQGLKVRERTPDEFGMVCSNWKDELFEHRNDRNAGPGRGWCRGLNERDFWCLVNHVIDRITVSSCKVFVGCHEKDPDTPICWVAIRRIEGLVLFEVMYLYARKLIREDPELAAGLERALLSEVNKIHPLAAERRSFNPFKELRR